VNYYEYTFACDPSPSPCEPETIRALLSALLSEAGFESFTETADSLQGYIPETAEDVGRIEAALASFPLEGVRIRFARNYIEARNWNEEWEKNYFQPVKIGSECILHAPFHETPPGFAYDIVVNPKMAFGTGNHETTRLMLEAILGLDLAGKAALDMGCGTAALAILAHKKGASPVLAVDIDEWAYMNALENKRLNRADSITVLQGGAEQLPGRGEFDFVFANINRNILLNDLRRYALCMKPGAWLLMSGFYTDDIPAINKECICNGLVFHSTAEENRWAILRMQKVN
jgi:ribosomal protein L11 methyltransferase